MAIKATKTGETPRFILRGYFKTQKDYDLSIARHSAEGWKLEQADDYADAFIKPQD